VIGFSVARLIREETATLPLHMNEGLEQRMRDLGDFIRDQRRNARLSLRKLSEQAGISNPYLSQIERGLRKPSAEILQAIARALRISAETLYVRAGILEAHDDGLDLVGEILRDTSINERQKQVLVDIYRTFQRENEHSQGARPGEVTPAIHP
jgi:transcriptional regulator with XRE-family HTH domain